MTSPVFVFIGSKGGVGTTSLCFELAKLLRDRGNVALIDADMAGRRSVAVLMDALHDLDAARDAGSAIAVARVNGTTVAEMAERYDAVFTLDNAEVEAFASSLSGFKAVLVDAPQPLAASVRPLVLRATRFFVVVEPTALGVAGAKTVLNNLRRFGVPANRLAILSNSREGSSPLSRSDVEGGLDMRLVAEIPHAGNRNFGRSVLALANYILALPPESEIRDLQPSTSVPIGSFRQENQQSFSSGGSNGHSAAGAGTVKVSARYDEVKLAIHAALLRRVDLVAASQAHTDKTKLKELRAKIEAITSEYISEQQLQGSAEEIAVLRQEIVNEALGLGPLEDLMADASVTEIMVNGFDSIYVERFGKIDQTGKRFTDERQLRLVIERIITPLGRRIDESSPMVDARLQDGSRVNAIIEPLSLNGATMTIRRFGLHRLQAEDLLKNGSVTAPVMDLLRAAIEGRLNVVISGGTGSGKTTFLNVLSSFLPSRERIVTIEDAAELLLNQPHVVRLESRPANIEGKGEIRIRDLLRNALRMRPDRIVIGECRGPEALDMLQAMNTGHDGSITTIHANSARDALARIETMVLMAGFDLPVRAIREQVASAIDFIVHTARMRDGSRKVIGISEVAGMEGEIVTMQEIVRYAQRGIDAEGKVMGEFQYSGVQPNCLKRFQEYGITYDSRALATLAPTGALW